MFRRFTDVVSVVTAVPRSRGTGWCPTIRITGREAGKPFVIVVDLFEVAYLTEKVAIAAGEQVAQARVQALQGPEDPDSPPYSPLL